MRSLELFSGAGGLALGLANAGCEHEALIEWDHEACDTMRLNHDRGVDPVGKWKINRMPEGSIIRSSPVLISLQADLLVSLFR
ncbi:MAG: DNA cytosine methyltransferase [Kiritimatiellae bacterium]|nr:DNA cytosine methyltransferase [Kiritimatiellia bacterium]